MIYGYYPSKIVANIIKIKYIITYDRYFIEWDFNFKCIKQSL